MVLHKSAEFRGIFRFFPTDSNGFRVIQRIFSIFRRKIPWNSVEFRGICQKKLKDSALLRGFVESFFFLIIFDKFRVITRIDRILTFRCNLSFVNKFCKLKSTRWVLHAFCNFLCASDKFEQRKIMCFTVSFSLPQSLHAGSHTYCIQNVGFWSTSSYCNWMIPWRAIFFDFLNVDIAKYYFKKLELSFKTWTNSGCKSYIRCIHP